MLTKLIETTDLLSPNHSVFYAGTKKNSSIAGAIGTVLISGMFVLTLIAFGVEIVEKRNPTAKVTKQITKDSTVYLKNYPLMVVFTNAFEFTPEVFKKEFDVYAQISEIVLENGTQTKNINLLSFEPCKAEFFVEADPQFQALNLENYYCINPFVKYDKEGKLIKEDISVKSTQNFDGDKILELGFTRKESRIDLPFDDEIIIGTNYIVNIVDSTNLEKPVINTLFSKYTPLSSKLGVLFNYTVSNDQVQSDEGLFFSDYITHSFISTRSVEANYTLISKDSPRVVTFNIFSSMITEKHEREYKKIQTVAAEASGILKIAVLLVKAVVCKFSEFAFYKANIGFIVNQRKYFQFVQDRNDSQDVVIDSKIKQKEENPSIFQYFFTRQRKFERRFISNKFLEWEFDILKIRKEIEQIKELASQGAVYSNVRRRE